MTCIVLLHAGDHVLMGADGLSAHPGTGTVFSREQRKILRFFDNGLNEVLLGFAGSQTMFQALELELCREDQEESPLNTSDAKTLYASLLELHERLKTVHGFNPYPDDAPINIVEWSNFDFLLASTSGLVCRVMSMREILAIDSCDALGSGAAFALTALEHGDCPEAALEYAADHNIYVGGKLTIARLDIPLDAR